jgi:hypothetical protein
VAWKDIGIAPRLVAIELMNIMMRIVILRVKVQFIQVRWRAVTSAPLVTAQVGSAETGDAYPRTWAAGHGPVSRHDPTVATSRRGSCWCGRSGPGGMGWRGRHGRDWPTAPGRLRVALPAGLLSGRWPASVPMKRRGGQRVLRGPCGSRMSCRGG